jgi:hypothetical protein
LNNIIDAINGSHKVILLVTPDYVTSVWARYKMDAALTAAIQQKHDDHCLIPLMVKRCKFTDYETHNYTRRPINWLGIKQLIQ